MFNWIPPQARVRGNGKALLAAVVGKPRSNSKCLFGTGEVWDVHRLFSLLVHSTA